MIYEAAKIAEYIVALSYRHGDDITQLKLQKLLYYAQGAYLALKGEALFSDEILAWKHGPVVYSVIRKYRQYGSRPLPKPETDVVAGIDEFDQIALAEIYEKYRGFTASQLVSKTHEEAPWKNAPDDDVIEPDSIKAFFAEHVYNEDALFGSIPVAEKLPAAWYHPEDDSVYATKL